MLYCGTPRRREATVSRESSDETDIHGHILNGFDYRLQAWIVDGTVTHVGDSPFVGRLVCDLKEAEVREA